CKHARQFIIGRAIALNVLNRDTDAGRIIVKKILLVDDARTTLLMERMMLEKRTSYQCITATNGLAPVQTANSECTALVLIDLVMPQMNAFEACKQIREHEE